jgi:formylglycine-generating enzyme required for sulfatase activity
MPRKTLPLLVTGSLIPFLAHAETVDFMTQVKPLLEGTCIHCHGPEKAEGEYRMDTKAAAFAGGENYAKETIVPKDPEASPVYWMTTEPADSADLMPPKKPLSAEQQAILKAWIAEGANWPEGVTLEEKPRMDFKNNILPLLSKGGPFKAQEQEMLRLWVEQGAVWPKDFKLGGKSEAEKGGLADNVELVKVIRENILATTKEKAEGDMKDYTGTIPKTGVKYDMLAIKGGEFTMGSPADEKGRADDEGPQHKVKVSPFWMGKFEVTWNMYEPFMITGVARNKDGSPENIPADAKPVDVVSSPTTPYTEMSFGMGTDGFPAICMTEHAASKFCQWLSAQTGHYYRLPTEAEWEYACRAGTTGAYSCPEDQLADFAVMDPEQVRVGYEKVGTKKPNPWGLHDMHGNVMEWCIDQYLDKGYAGLDGKTTENPLAIPTTLYPRVARGGSWYDPPEELRSARRIASNENWKVQDPQLPKSIWYHTDAHWLGFRIVRPLEVPETEKMHLLWNLGTVDSN